MSEDALRKAINDRFIANWAGSSLTTEVDYGDNQKFTPPVNSAGWCRLVVNRQNHENAEIGVNFQRTEGLIVVQCFVPLNSGEKKLDTMVQEVRSIFQNKNFDGVKTYATSSIRVGESGEWYQFNAKTFFQYDVFS